MRLQETLPKQPAALTQIHMCGSHLSESQLCLEEPGLTDQPCSAQDYSNSITPKFGSRVTQSPDKLQEHEMPQSTGALRTEAVRALFAVSMQK